MEDLSFLFEISLKHDLIGFFLGLTEDDGPAVPATVKVDNISNNCISVMVGTVQAQMLHSLGSPDLRVLDEINEIFFR